MISFQLLYSFLRKFFFLFKVNLDWNLKNERRQWREAILCYADAHHYSCDFPCPSESKPNCLAKSKTISPGAKRHSSRPVRPWLLQSSSAPAVTLFLSLAQEGAGGLLGASTQKEEATCSQMGGRTVDPPDGTELIGHVSPIHPVGRGRSGDRYIRSLLSKKGEDLCNSCRKMTSEIMKRLHVM